LASTQPSPGGGSAAAVVAALGFSLLGKVSAISQTKQKASFQKEIRESKSLEKIAMKLADGDAKAYSAVIKAYQIKAVTEGHKKSRREKIDRALGASFEVPFQLLQTVKQGEILLEKLLKRSDGAIKSDLEVADHLFEAAAESVHHLAHSNLDYIKDEKLKAALFTKLKGLR
jgi:formiminotetrahydrofolate cyclodeaminase